MRKLSDFIKNPLDLPAAIVRFALANTMKNDRRYISILYYATFGRKINLDTPVTFSEKIQWLKLYDRNPKYTQMVDKYAVKEYVSGIIGEEHVIPTLGIWDNAEDIDWGNLPDKFVLKCTHDSGTIIVVKDKSKLNRESAIRKLRSGLKRDYYLYCREWPYKNVPRRIIAEKYIEPMPGRDDLPDFKFFCFNGEPRYCQVISGRNSKMCIDFFDYDWNHQPFHEPKNYPFADIIIEKPKNLNKMWEMARKLATDKSFSRIDFYDLGDQVYFGEITFYPTSGMGGFRPKSWDKQFGELIQLPNSNGQND